MTLKELYKKQSAEKLALVVGLARHYVLEKGTTHGMNDFLVKTLEANSTTLTRYASRRGGTPVALAMIRPELTCDTAKVETWKEIKLRHKIEGLQLITAKMREYGSNSRVARELGVDYGHLSSYVRERTGLTIMAFRKKTICQ